MFINSIYQQKNYVSPLFLLGLLTIFFACLLSFQNYGFDNFFKVVKAIYPTNPPKVAYLRWAKPNPEKDCNADNKHCVSESSTYSFEILYEAESPLLTNDFSIYLNGNLVSQSKAENVSLLSSGTFTASVNLVPGSNTLYVQVGDKRTSVLQVYYRLGKPTLYLLAAGVKSNLAYPDSDAQKIITLFEQQAADVGMYYVEPFHIPTSETTKGTIKNKIISINQRFIKPNDIFMLYLSSHGELRDGQFYFHCVDFSENSFKETTLSQDELKDFLSAIHCKKIIFIDACRSEPNSPKADNASTINQHIEELQKTLDADAFFMSCSDREHSYECKELRMATFTYAIVQGLGNGLADLNKDSTITLHELSLYVKNETPKLNQKYKLAEIQHPKIIFKQHSSSEDLLANKPLFRYTGKKLDLFPKNESPSTPLPMSVVSTDLQQAEENFKKQRYTEAFPVFVKELQKLNPTQMYELGFMYLWKDPNKPNKEEAIKCLLVAANAGHGEAMAQLGEIYHGLGNITEARKWYKKGVDAGSLTAREGWEEVKEGR